MKSLFYESNEGVGQSKAHAFPRAVDAHSIVQKVPKRRHGWRERQEHGECEADFEYDAASLSQADGCKGGVVVLAGIVERLRGLKNAAVLSCGSYAVLAPCCDIHTFGMKFPIDVAFVDARGVVIAAVRHVSPARRLRYRKACMVLERRSCKDAWFEPGQAVFVLPR